STAVSKSRSSSTRSTARPNQSTTHQGSRPIAPEPAHEHYRRLRRPTHPDRAQWLRAWYAEKSMWALYALTAALLTSFLPIINKRILTTADVAVVAWIPNALSLPLLLVVTLALIGWSSIDGLFLLAVLASGILNLVATLASTRALQLADASVATPFLSFNPAFTLLLSIFTLREIPSVRGIVGVLLIVLGAYLFQVKEVGKGMLAPVQALVRQPGVLLAIGASFVWGLTPIAEKIAIQHTIPENPLMVAFVTTILTVVLLTPALWRSAGDLLEQVRRQRHLFGTAGLISGV